MNRSDPYEARFRELAIAAGIDLDSRIGKPGSLRGMPAWCGFRTAAQTEQNANAQAEAAAQIVNLHLQEPRFREANRRIGTPLFAGADSGNSDAVMADQAVAAAMGRKHVHDDQNRPSSSCAGRAGRFAAAWRLWSFILSHLLCHKRRRREQHLTCTGVFVMDIISARGAVK